MDEEWILGSEGMNRWGLTKAQSTNLTSELSRACAPRSCEDWEDYYFNNAEQKKKNGIRVTRDYITGLGQTLHIKLSEVVQNELESITEGECVDYAYNLVLNRTYEGYRAEIDEILAEIKRLS